MSEFLKAHKEATLYFCTLTTVGWMDVFPSAFRHTASGGSYYLPSISEFLKAHQEADPERTVPLFWEGTAERR